MSKIKGNDVITNALCVKEKITWQDFEDYLAKKDEPGRSESELVTTDGEQSLSNKIISDSTCTMRHSIKALRCQTSWHNTIAQL